MRWIIALIIGGAILCILFVEISDVSAFYISVTGVTLTLIALTIAISQILRVKKISKAIEENSKDYKNAIRKEFIKWELDKMTRCCDVIQLCASTNNSLPIWRKMLNETHQSIEWCCGLPEAEVMFGSDRHRRLGNYARRVVAEKKNITNEIGNPRNDFDPLKFLNFIDDFAEFLNQIRPNPVDSIRV